jgi:hypothetical protein
MEASEELYLIDSAFSCFASVLNTSNVKHKYFFLMITDTIGYTISNNFLPNFKICPVYQLHGFKPPETIE